MTIWQNTRHSLSYRMLSAWIPVEEKKAPTVAPHVRRRAYRALTGHRLCAPIRHRQDQVPGTHNEACAPAGRDNQEARCRAAFAPADKTGLPRARIYRVRAGSPLRGLPIGQSPGQYQDKSQLIRTCPDIVLINLSSSAMRPIRNARSETAPPAVQFRKRHSR